MANVKTQDPSESGKQVERRLRGKMAKTVSNWISERREINRAEEVSAIRRMFGQ